MASYRNTALIPPNPIVEPLPELQKPPNDLLRPTPSVRCFNPHIFLVLEALCQAIIPPDESYGGAIEAGVPEFIELLASENKNYRIRLKGGLMWLDAKCRRSFGKSFIECDAREQDLMLRPISNREENTDSSLSHGREFFQFVRKLTLDGFFTSREGIAYLGYVGNERLLEFLGCPEVPQKRDYPSSGQ